MTVKDKYKWPINQPCEKFDFGWCDRTHELAFKNYFPKDSKVIIDLGTFMGKSAKMLASIFPNAYIYTIDNFGDDDDYIRWLCKDNPEFLETCMRACSIAIANLWEYKDRITVIHNDSIGGMQELEAEGIMPDAVYVDANHAETYVYNDLVFIVETWPNAVIVGDDWQIGTVKNAIHKFCFDKHRDFEIFGERCFKVR